MISHHSILRRVKNSRIAWTLLILALVLLFNLVFTKGFFHIEIKDGHLFGSLIDILNRAAPTMLLAIGMTFVIATGGVDLSVGAVVAISGALAASMVGGKLVLKGDVQEYISIYPMWLAIAAALLVSLASGIWNGLLVSRAKIQPMVATLILMVAGRGVAQLITNGQIITIYYKSYHYIGTGYLLGLPFTVFIVGLVLLVAWLLARKTAIGLFVESVGGNRTASRLAGINSANVILSVYTFCGFCAGIAGLIVSSNVKSADGNNAGLWSELDAILAVVIGGTSFTGGRFYLMGSVVGALIIQSLTTTIYSVGVPPEINLVVKAIVVFIVSLLQSESFRKTVFGNPAGKGRVSA
mgnify:FL=1